MKTREAIEKLVYLPILRYEEHTVTTSELGESLRMAIKALRDQEAMESDIGIFCPECRRGVKRHIYGINVDYCPFCGTKIDWGKYE